MGRRIIGFQDEGLFVFGDSLGDPAFHCQCECQIVVGIGIVRLQDNDTFEVSPRVRGPALRGQREAEICMRVGMVRVKDHGKFELGYRVRNPALHCQRHAQTDVDLRLVGIGIAGIRISQAVPAIHNLAALPWPVGHQSEPRNVVIQYLCFEKHFKMRKRFALA